MRGFRQLFFVSLFVVASACGGSGDSAPKPLDKHIDDMYIARIPLDQQGSVVEAQNKWSISKMEAANAQAQLDEADSQLHQAKNDQKAAKLSIDSAIAAKKSAEASADMNRVNSAQKDLRAAEDSEKAANARVKYFEAYKNYLKKFVRYTQENQYWREAQYEAAKAAIAKQNNIAPKGVTLDDFPKQLEARQKRVEGAKNKAESEKKKAGEKRQDWLNKQSAADKATGRTGVLYDPMAPSNNGGPTMQKGGMAQEKPEAIKPMASNPGNMNSTPANATNAGATEGGSEGSNAGGNAGGGDGSAPQ
jgi:hypothetical protein